jgi:hypothetical protein
MKKETFLIFFLTILLSSWVEGQSLLDEELGQIADSFVKEVESKITGGSIAIGEFTNSDGKDSELGKYISEGFAVALMKKTQKFNIIDRSQIKILDEEALLGSQGVGRIPPSSSQGIDSLEGITFRVYGKLTPVGNKIRIFITAVYLKKQIKSIAIDGFITRTSTIDKMQSNQNNDAQNSTNTSSNSSSEMKSFSYKHIKIAESGCISNGNYIDCNFTITSLNKNDMFSIKIEGTSLINSNEKRVNPFKLFMNDKEGYMIANSSLKANIPITAKIRFAKTEIQGNKIPAIEINCTAPAANTYPFTAKFENLILKL